MRMNVVQVVSVIMLMLSTASSGADGALVWTEDNVVGLSITLQSASEIEQLRFAQDGNLAATFGRINGDSAAITPMLLKWAISNGILNFGEGQFADQFILISRDSSYLVVRSRSGKELRFRILEQAHAQPGVQADRGLDPK